MTIAPALRVGGLEIIGPGQQKGTLGCLAVTKLDREIVMVTAAHVLLNGWGADQSRAITLGSSNPVRGVATVGKASVGAGIKTCLSDSATGYISPDELQDIVRHVGVPRGKAARPRREDLVRICGAVTPLGRGVIANPRFDTPFSTSFDRFGEIEFIDQVQVAPIATAPLPTHGDSGAAVLDQDGNILGLHIAGNATLGLFSPVQQIEFELEIDILTAANAQELVGFVPPLIEDKGDLDPAAAAANRLPEGTTEEDVDVLARTIYGEARGEPPEGQSAVAAVVLNRRDMRRASWGTTIAAVCKAPMQFSCWNTNDERSREYRAMIERVSDSSPSFRGCLEVARAACLGRLKDDIDKATHYYAVNAKDPSWRPNWARNATPCRTIGRHVFFNNIP